MVFKVATSFLYKMITYASGSLTLLASSISGGLVYILNKMGKRAEEENLYIIFTAEFIGFTLFLLFLFADYRTGLIASKYLNSISENPQKNWKKSYKMYRTFWKLLGVLLISIMLMFLCLFAEVIDSNFIWVFLWFLVGFWILASSFEFHSIGENIEKWSGSKPEIFNFWDKIVNVIEQKAIKKVGDSFNVLESDPEDENQNPK